MKRIRRLAAVALICLLQCSVVRTAQSAEKAGEKGRRKRRALQEADEDAMFAAAVLGFVHDRVSDVGDVLRVVGDTAGGLAGGSIKAVGASVNGISSVLDAASRGVSTKKPNLANKQQPLPPSDNSNGNEGGNGPEDRRTEEPASPDNLAETGPSDNRSSTNGKKKGKGGNPDPFERIETVARSSLAGSLKILSAAVGGVGEAVFQTGTVAEGLAGGAGQVAEDLVRVVQGAVGWARDDMVKFTGRNSRPFDARTGSNGPNLPTTASNGGSPLCEQSAQSETAKQSPSSNFNPPTAADIEGLLSAREIWERMCGLTRILFEAVLREAATLFRRRNGAPPPAPRFAVLMILALVLWSRRRRRRSPPPQPTTPSTPPPASREAAAPSTPLRHAQARPAPPRVDSSQGAPTPMSAAAAGLASPSRSLFEVSWPLGSMLAPRASGSPSRGPIQGPDGLDPSLPSPAQARAGQPRTGRPRVLQTQPWTGRVGGRGFREMVRGAWGRIGAAVVAPWRRGWRWVRGGVGAGEKRRCGGRRYWVWLVLLWLVASVLEERERDRVAWLAWDEGFRAGQASRAFDPAVEAETVVWLNHAIGSMWGGHGTASSEGREGISVPDHRVDGDALDGLSSFVAERVVEGILEALEEMKPTSIVGVKLQEVELGSSAPQILGVKVLDPASPASPGWGDGRCSGGVKCISFRVDLEMASKGLRVGVRVKASSLEKAKLPAGTVRLLELFYRGSVSVRAELRDEFPFVKVALVSFDDVPDVEVRLEQWGLDALSLGAVDEWARIGLRQALKPFVLPGFLVVDVVEKLCPECAERERTQALQPHPPALPSSRLSAAAAAMGDPPAPSPSKKSSGSGSGGTGAASGSKSLRRERGATGGRLGKKTAGKNDRSGNHDRSPAGRSGQQARGASPAVVHSFDADRRDSEHGSATTATTAPGRSRQGGGAEQGGSGRAAAMSDLYEFRGGMGGALQWLKDRVSETVAGGRRGDERRAAEWKGVD